MAGKKPDYHGLRDRMKPESLMMSYGYDPTLSEGSIKSPIFQTSTFVFKSAQDGKEFFEIALGMKDAPKDKEPGLIYSRLNNPDLEILEDRLTLFDGAEAAAVFESGMAAISTVLMEVLKPGDVVLHSEPVYGGTDHFVKGILSKFGIQAMAFYPWETADEIRGRLTQNGLGPRVAAIYFESPANPTNHHVDIKMCVELARELSKTSKVTEKVLTIMDNTFLGPIFQKPIALGVDLLIYSATKYLGGHSDLIAGAAIGSCDLIGRVKGMRTYMGSMASPYTGWLLLRSLETLKIRMQRQNETAQKVAAWLASQPQVEKVYYPGLLKKGDPQYDIYLRQCTAPGAMISFDVRGGEKEAFKVLDSLKLIRLAVSLGGTESLAEHPATMTHAGVAPETKLKMGISEKMIRLSIGIEEAEDLCWDLGQALVGSQSR